MPFLTVKSRLVELSEWQMHIINKINTRICENQLSIYALESSYEHKLTLRPTKLLKSKGKRLSIRPALQLNTTIAVKTKQKKERKRR
jgi:hypothetical protein